MQRIRRHLTFANITAVLALVVAMGGTAYAGSLITSKDIKNGTIQTVDLAPATRTYAYSSSALNVPLCKYNAGSCLNATTVASLYIAKPGHYLIIASLMIENNDVSTPTQFKCRLNSGDATVYDEKWLGTSSASGDSSIMPMTLQVTDTYTATKNNTVPSRTVTLECINEGVDLTSAPAAQNAALTAIRLASITDPAPPVT